MKRPTILQIIPELDTGGAEMSAIEVAGAVASAGGRALVMSEGGRMVARLEKAGGEFVPFAAASKNPLRILWNAGAIAKFAKSEDVDLIHARSRAPAWSGFIGARRACVPFLTTYHGAYNERGPIKRAYNRVMVRGELVIANSEFTSALIQERYGTPADKIRVIHRGVDGRVYSPSAVTSGQVASMRRAWGVEEGDEILLMPARLTHWKGQGVVVAAMRALKERGALGRIVAILAGDDQGRSEYRMQLERGIDAGGLAGHVRLVGHVSDMPTAYAASQLVVVASTEPEAFGRVATEAQIMGVPVIATAIGAPQETVLAPPRAPDASRTGWLVPPGDHQALADAISALSQLSQEDKSELSSRSREHVLANFSLAEMCRKTLAVYDEILSSDLEQRFQPL